MRICRYAYAGGEERGMTGERDREGGEAENTAAKEYACKQRHQRVCPPRQNPIPPLKDMVGAASGRCNGVAEWIAASFFNARRRGRRAARRSPPPRETSPPSSRFKGKAAAFARKASKSRRGGRAHAFFAPFSLLLARQRWLPRAAGTRGAQFEKVSVHAKRRVATSSVALQIADSREVYGMPRSKDHANHHTEHIQIQRSTDRTTRGRNQQQRL